MGSYWTVCRSSQPASQSRCKTLPIVFDHGISFKARPCPNAELRSVSAWYFDWNIEKCHQSHVDLCPGDEKPLFSGKLNSFPTEEDCMNGIRIYAPIFFCIHI